MFIAPIKVGAGIVRKVYNGWKERRTWPWTYLEGIDIEGRERIKIALASTRNQHSSLQGYVCRSLRQEVKEKMQKVSHQITFPSTVQRSLGVCPAYLSPEGSSGSWRGGRGSRTNSWEQAVQVSAHQPGRQETVGPESALKERNPIWLLCGSINLPCWWPRLVAESWCRYLLLPVNCHNLCGTPKEPSHLHIVHAVHYLSAGDPGSIPG